MEDGRRKTKDKRGEDRRQKMEEGRRRTKNKKIEDGRRKAKDLRRKTEDGRQKIQNGMKKKTLVPIPRSTITRALHLWPK